MAGGQLASSLTPILQANDGDIIAGFGPGLGRYSPLTLAQSYVPVGAVLLGAGAGASRGAPMPTEATGEEAFATIGLHAAFTITAVTTAGVTSKVLSPVFGDTSGTVMEGDDPRVLAAAQLMAKADATLAAAQAALNAVGQGGGGTGNSLPLKEQLDTYPTYDDGSGYWFNAGVLTKSGTT